MTALPTKQNDARVLGVFTPAGAAMAGALALAFVGLFFRWFHLQHLHTLDALDDWGHVYIVPLFSAYLVWRERARINVIAPEVFWPGLAPLLLGVMAYFFCVVGVRNHMLQGFAMILTVFGLVLLLLGPTMIRHLFIPIAFLAFGVSVSQQIMTELTFPLQLVASFGASIVLGALSLFTDFTVDAQANMITVTNAAGIARELDVAAACSGMRMVVAFVALAGVTAILGCRFWWQRAAILLLAAPVAILINIGRVAVLGLLTLSDPNLAKGGAHTAIGTLLLAPGLLLFLLLVKALNKAVTDAKASGVGA
ncbi:MAG: exosortase/archaeosortase family protein [Phycisphaerales bacterium]